jgi:flagellar biosynthesis anti-sigma factor FlgM
MRINDPNPLSNVPPTPAGETSPAQPAPQISQEPQATINISSDHADLSSVAERLGDMQQPDSARTERLRQLREAIASDSYQVDSPAVSRAMVDDALTIKHPKP